MTRLAAILWFAALLAPAAGTNRSLFVFHTGPHNCSDDCVWHQYPWPAVHTVLMFEPYPLLAVAARAAGANVGVSLGMPENISNASSRRQTISSAMNSCRSLPGCNTLNIDIESPVGNGSAASHELTTFVTELVAAAKQGSEPYSLVYDAAARPGYEGRYYDYGAFSDSGIDWFFVMDYDLNDYDDPAPWNDHSLANSPLPVVEKGLRELIAILPASKVVVGLPFYGYEYVGFVGERPVANFHRKVRDFSGLLHNNSGWSRHFDNVSRTPFLRRGKGLLRREIWYDDPSSIAQKVAVARALGLSHAGCWTGNSLDYDAGAPIPAHLFWEALTL